MPNPLLWLRRVWLARAMRDYPVYDPPNKREERLLSKEDAIANFDYFMKHKEHRAEHFKIWLRKYFFLNIKDNLSSLKKLNYWAIRYSGLLYPMGGDNDPYINLSVTWSSQFIGCNVLYDLGIAIGEITRNTCSGLRWVFDPTADILPKTARILRNERGSGFQQPKLVGGPNPAWIYSPLSYARQFAYQMMLIQTHPKSKAKFQREPRLVKNIILLQLTNQLQEAIRYSKSSLDDNPLWQGIPKAHVAAFIDNDTDHDGDF